MYDLWRDGRLPIMIEKLYETIEHYGKYYRIFEMFESHTCWLWFTPEMFSNQPDFRYGLVCGREQELDYFSRERHEPLDTSVWRVLQKDWAGNDNVHLVEQPRLDRTRNHVVSL